MSFTRTSLRISAGVIVWVLHFTAIYGITALACARGWHGVVAPAIVISGAVAGLATIALMVAGWRHRQEFEYWLSATIAGFALVAIVYETIPLLAVPICA